MDAELFFDFIFAKNHCILEQSFWKYYVNGAHN